MAEDKNDNRQKIWGGRFSKSPSQIMQSINTSIDFDKRLWREDIAASRAHLDMLIAQALIQVEDGKAIADGLEQIQQEIEAGQFPFRAEYEDIHMNIEARLREMIGPAAGRLHTARSRNDQVATDFRLWLRNELEQVDNLLVDLQRAFLSQAEQAYDAIMPGFTHLQTAQPVVWGHHMLAYIEMFARDRNRFETARDRLNESPLGSAALAGTGFDIDRQMSAKALGFKRPMRNSLDAVSARDFAIETIGHAAICAMHLSRLAEELVIWASAPFGFIALDDSWSTGSSIMPQKRNPDAAELIRAKTGRIYGSLQALLVVMKGLPLAYSKDMQEDKEAVFDAMDALNLSLRAMAGMVGSMTPNRKKMYKAAAAGFSTATDLADWLVRELGLAFRDAHHVTGALVKLAEEAGLDLADLSLEQMQSVEPRIHKGIYLVLSVKNSVASRNSFGGTAPDQVKQQIDYWKERLT